MDWPHGCTHVGLYIFLHKLLSGDVHPHPGPTTVSIANITNADSSLDVIGKMDSDIQLVSEVSLAAADINKIKRRLRDDYNRTAIFTNTDPECTHLTGGGRRNHAEPV